MNSFHIQYDGDLWNLTAEGTDRSFGAYETKPEAVAGAVEILSAHTGSLKIHRKDGVVEEMRDFAGAFPPDE